MNKKSINYPFWIITGIGIFATLIFLYIFVYNYAIKTVKSAVLLERAYPKIKPEEFVNELINKSKEKNIKIIQIRQEKNLYIIQMVDEDKISKLTQIAPQLAPIAIINLTIYDIGDGITVVGNNPYLWDIVVDSNYVDDLAESFEKELIDMFDSIYWSIKEKKKSI